MYTSPTVESGDEIKITFGDGGTITGFVTKVQLGSDRHQTQIMTINVYASTTKQPQAGKTLIWIEGQGRGKLAMLRRRTEI